MFTTDLINILTKMENTLTNINGGIQQMAISQAQFDADLAALVTAINNLITAVNNLPQPGTPDFTAEDQQVLTAAQAVQAEITKIKPS